MYVRRLAEMAGYRPRYTLYEDMVILHYIIQMQSYYRIRERSFWEDVANCGYVDRTWQSLKERFEKHILPRIGDLRYAIPPYEKKYIELANHQLHSRYRNAEYPGIGDEYHQEEYVDDSGDSHNLAQGKGL